MYYRLSTTAAVVGATCAGFAIELFDPEPPPGHVVATTGYVILDSKTGQPLGYATSLKDCTLEVDAIDAERAPPEPEADAPSL